MAKDFPTARDLDLGRPELGSLRAEDDVAEEREFESSSQGIAVDGRDDRLWEGLDGAPLREPLGVSVRGDATLQHVADVGARCEGPTCAGEDHAAHRSVVCRFAQRGLKFLKEVLGERVELGRAV